MIRTGADIHGYLAVTCPVRWTFAPRKVGVRREGFALWTFSLTTEPFTSYLLGCPITSGR